MCNYYNLRIRYHIILFNYTAVSNNINCRFTLLNISYMLLSGNSVLKQNTVCSSMACYVHVYFYKTQKRQMFKCFRFAALIIE